MKSNSPNPIIQNLSDLINLLLIAVLLMNSACQDLFQKEKEVSEYNPTKSIKRNISRWEKFNRQYDNNWNVIWNKNTRTPRKISGFNIKYDIPVNKKNIEDITFEFINKNKRLLQVDPKSLSLPKIDIEQIDSNSTGNSYVYYHQLYNGIPVYNSSVKLIFHGQELVQFGSDYYPNIRTITIPKLSKKDIRKLIMESFSMVDSITPENINLIIFPVTTKNILQYHLAYEIILPITGHTDKSMSPVKRDCNTGDANPAKWKLFIDANTGELLGKVNLLLDYDIYGYSHGHVFPQSPPQDQVTVDIEEIYVYAWDGPAKKDSSVTNSVGYYFLTNMNFEPTKITAHLKGPHVRVYNDELSQDASFEEVIVNGQIPEILNFNWNDYDNSYWNVETHAYYHTHFIRNWFKRGGPFNIVPVSPVGPDEDYVEAIVRKGESQYICNAKAAIGHGQLLFGKGIGLGECLDLALCADAVYHEYTHLITEQFYNNAGIFLGGGEGYAYNSEFGAMHEAMSDYFPASITNVINTCQGCCNVDDVRNIDIPDKRYPDDLAGNPHASGMILSGAIWDVRKQLGAEYTDNLTIRALKHIPTSFSEYLCAFLEEDDNPTYAGQGADNHPENGTPNIDLICEQFLNVHGIYHPYCNFLSDHPLANIISPSTVDEVINVTNNSVMAIDIIGTAFGSNQGDLQQYTVEYLSDRDMDTWYSDHITLVNNGIEPVYEDILANWDLSEMENGFYLVRLIVTDLANQSDTAFTKIFIDNKLMAGWPLNTNSTFPCPPVAWDIDPEFPGKEILARDMTGNIYCYRLDGSPAHGWYLPLSIASDPCITPVVADLNADCNPDIVYAGGNEVRTILSHLSVLDFPPGELPDWPKILDHEMNEFYSIAVADIDWDQYPEVIMAVEDGSIYAWNYDGSIVEGWPVHVGAGIHKDIAVGDLVTHIWRIPGALPTTRFPWNFGDLIVDGSPVNVGYETNIEIGNRRYDLIDGTLTDREFVEAVIQNEEVYNYIILMDGLEIVACNDDGEIKVYNAKGKLMRGWPKVINYPFASPAIADIDGDHDLEIIIGDLNEEGSRFGNVYAFHHNGSPVQNWPVSLERDIYGNTSIVIADLNNDGLPEIILEGEQKVYIWNADASAYTGSPYEVGSPCFLQYCVCNKSPLIADINHDNQKEILKPNYNIMFGRDFNEYQQLGSYWTNKLFAIDHSGSNLPDWPMYIPSYRTPYESLSSAMFSISDVDYDGQFEILAGSHGLYTWDLPGSGSRIPVGEWTQYREDTWKRGFYSNLPDLTIESYELVRNNSNKEVRFTIQNIGLTKAKAFSVNIELFINTPRPEPEFRIEKTINVDMLEEGGSLLLTDNFNECEFPNISTPSFLEDRINHGYIKIQVDYPDNIKEDNEGNNMLVINKFEELFP